MQSQHRWKKKGKCVRATKLLILQMWWMQNALTEKPGQKRYKKKTSGQASTLPSHRKAGKCRWPPTCFYKHRSCSKKYEDVPQKKENARKQKKKQDRQAKKTEKAKKKQVQTHTSITHAKKKNASQRQKTDMEQAQKKATKPKAKSWHVRRSAPLKWVCSRSRRTEKKKEGKEFEWNPKIRQTKAIQKALRIIIRHADRTAICQHLPRLTNPSKRYWKKKKAGPTANSRKAIAQRKTSFQKSPPSFEQTAR